MLKELGNRENGMMRFRVIPIHSNDSSLFSNLFFVHIPRDFL